MLLPPAQPQGPDVKAFWKWLLTSTFILVGCGGGGHPTYTLSGKVSGLLGSGLVLQDGVGHTLSVAEDATDFSFSAPLSGGTAYDVAVVTQPSSRPAQFCSIANPSGTLTSTVNSIVVTCVGPFVYVPTYQGVSAFTMNVETGALIEIAGSPFPVGVFNSSRMLAVDPTGKFAYFPDDGGIEAWTINRASGVLTPVAGSPFPAGTELVDTTIDPNGKFVYVTDFESNNIWAYSIDPASGALTAVAGSPFPVAPCPGGTPCPFALTFEPTGRFMYVGMANQVGQANLVSAYAINGGTGALTLVDGTPVALGSDDFVYFPPIVIDPSGKFLYALDGNVYGFMIDASTGGLTPVPGSPYAPYATGVTTSSMTIDPSDKFLYVCNYKFADGDSITALSIDPGTGALAPVIGSPFAAAGRDPAGLSFAANTRYAYTVEAFSQQLEGFARDPVTGALSSLGTFSGGAVPLNLAVDPSGSFVYSTNAGNNRAPPPVIFGNAINPQTGALTPVPQPDEGFPTGDDPGEPIIVGPN